jgi:hypothetical protein
MLIKGTTNTHIHTFSMSAKHTILPLVLAGILILAVLTTVSTNNHAFAFGSSFTFASPMSSDENNNTGNEQQQSSNTGNAQENNNTGNEQQQSSNTGNAQENNNTGNEQQQSSNTGNAQENNNTGNEQQQSSNATSSTGSTDDERLFLKQAYNNGYGAGSGGFIDSCDDWFKPIPGFAFPKDTIPYCHQGFVAGKHDKETGKIH